MKRNRAEPATQTPAKTPRRYAAPSAHQKLPQQLPQKPQSREAEEKRPPPGDTPGAPSSSSSSSSAAAAAAAAAAATAQEIEWAQHVGWDSAGAWSTWGVAEETLLGWFPFADEHFHGAGPFWEEESYCCCSYCYYHDDIWHLQHIHEAPNKN